MSDTTEPIASENVRQQQIDRMTLELLVNKSHYRKYLEKTDPTEYAKKQERYDRFDHYRGNIGALFKEMLNDYSVSGTSPHLGNADTQELFSAFVDKCIYYFETREFDHASTSSGTGHGTGDGTWDEDDGDVLFGEPMRTIRENAATYSAPFANHYRPGNSFWGKNIHKGLRK